MMPSFTLKNVVRATAIFFFVALFVTQCTSFPKSAFERLCREDGRVIVLEENGWNSFVQATQETYIESNRLPLEMGHTSLVEDREWLRIFPLQPFEYESAFTRGEVSLPSYFPARNDSTISLDGRPVAVLVNYFVEQEGFGADTSLSCLIDVPEVYGVEAPELPIPTPQITEDNPVD